MIPWYVWMLVGLVLLIIELTVGTMYLLWVACGAFLAGVVALFVGSVWWLPWLVFSVASFVLIALTRPLARSVEDMEGLQSNVDALVGKEAIVLVEIDSVKNTGRVRVGSDEWRARCDVSVPRDERVTIQGVEGTTLIVRPTAG